MSENIGVPGPEEDKEMLRTLPLGLSSSMATMVAGGPDRESLHSEKRRKKREKDQDFAEVSFVNFTL